MMASKERRRWTFEVSKIDFICPVRNPLLAEDTIPNKYVPIFVHKERMAKAQEALAYLLEEGGAVDPS